MVYTTSLFIVFMLFFFIVLLFGVNNAIKTIPMLLFLFFLIYFLGWFIVQFAWLIIPLIIIRYFMNRNAPKKKRRTYYRYTTNAEDFEEFFRRAGGFNGSYGGYSGGYSGRTNSSNSNPFEYTQDKSRYYKILGVEKGVTKEELKKAYRELVKQHHPDRFSNATQKEKDYHETKLKEINEAYEKLLSDFA